MRRHSDKGEKVLMAGKTGKERGVDMKNNGTGYTKLSGVDYAKKFGIGTDTIGRDKKKLREAYERVWHTRNFEIDKLWIRVTYFWGFIAAIFAGYIAVLNGENNEKALEIHLDLYLILLGIVFSVAWFLVSKGSKSWQQNWEKHITKLEDEISGPLYKTVYVTDKPYYSVTRINEVLGCVVIAVWVLLFVQYLTGKADPNKSVDCFEIAAICLALFCVMYLICGCYSEGSGHKIDTEDENGVFFERPE